MISNICKAEVVKQVAVELEVGSKVETILMEVVVAADGG